MTTSRDDGLKTCPDCGEHVRAEARICRFCRYDFAIPEVKSEARAHEDAAAPGHTEEPAPRTKKWRPRALPLLVLALLVLGAAVAAVAGMALRSVSCEGAPDDAAESALLSSSSIGADLAFEQGGVAQALCVDFTGDGKKDLVASVLSGGSGGAAGWAAFKNDGDSWRLVLERTGELGYDLRLRGNQIVESLPLFEEGKPAVGPRGRTGHREQAYQWDGRRLARAGPAVEIDAP